MAKSKKLHKQNEKLPLKLTLYQRFGIYFFKKPSISFGIWTAFVFFGILSYTVLLQRQGFPNVEVPISMVSGTYFVNDKSKVDSEIVRPLTEVIKKQQSVKKSSSSSGDNFFTIIVEYKDNFNAPKANEDLKNTISAQLTLPINSNIEYKTVNGGKINNEFDAIISISSEKLDLSSLVKKSEKIRSQLSGTSGINTTVLLNPYKSGVNPQTSQKIIVQKTFDRFYFYEKNKTSNFNPSISIGIVAESTSDAIHLEKHINEKLQSILLAEEFKELHAQVSAGFADNIKNQIKNLQTNLLEGLAVVILISFLLISWRAGLVTSLSMLTVLLITIGLLYIFGLTLNTITLFALVLCLGLIVDDTTISVEAIDANRQGDDSNVSVIVKSLKKVARASTSGTLVTMLAFAPMLFISGVLGKFIWVLPVTIIISLAVSLIVSLSLVPFLSRYLLLSQKGRKAKFKFNPVIRVERIVSELLAKMVRIGKKSRIKGALIGIVAILISFAFLVASGPIYKKLKFDIFPSTKDSNEMLVSLQFKSVFATDNTIETSQQSADKVNQKIVQTLGSNLKTAAYLNTGDQNQALIRIQLVDFTKRNTKSPQLVSSLDTALKDIENVKAKVSQNDAGPPKDDFPFRVQIIGEDVAKTSKLATDIASFLQGREVIRPSVNTKAKVIRTELAGLDSTIIRKNSDRVIEVKAAFDSDDTSALVTAAKNAVELEFQGSKLQDYGLGSNPLQYDFGNEANNQESFKTMLVAFPILLIVMYILLALQFRSLLQPLLIFTAIPFSFFGVGIGLYLTKNPLSFFVMIGFFALIGIAVNNTILLTDYANQSRKEGLSVLDSVAEALRARFRPLIATSLTSIVALIPLALSDPFWESLSYTLIFGLLSSTLLVIISFPYYYIAIEVIRRAPRIAINKIKKSK